MGNKVSHPEHLFPWDCAVLLEEAALGKVAYFGEVLGNALDTHAASPEYCHAIEVLAEIIWFYDGL